MSPKVSIIVPVYNAAPYLEECLDSLTGQLSGDVEVICIDDGSTDDSAGIIAAYAAQRTNVRLLAQANAGAGVARNAGLAVATGEFIAFCDPDDYYKPNLLSCVVSAMESENADIGIVRWERFQDGTRSLLPATPFPAQIRRLLASGRRAFAPEEFASGIFNIVGHSVCDKVFRHKLIRDFQLGFQPLRRTNDLFFATMALAMARRVVVVDEAMYCYRKGISSTTSRDEYAGLFCVGCRELKKRLVAAGRFDIFRESFVRTVVSSAKFDILSIASNEVLKKKYPEIRANVLELTEGWDFEHCPPGGSADLRNYYFKLKSRETPLPRARVTTIITTYNHAPFIAQAIDSAIMQRGVDQEIIISDDASTDGTDRIVAEYARRYPNLIKNLSSRTNLGISGNMRKCLDAATGEFVAIIEGDDYWSAQEKLWRQTEFLRDNPDCSMVFSRIAAIRKNGDTPRTYKVQEGLPGKIRGMQMFVNGRCGGVCMNFTTCMYRRELLRGLPEILFKYRISELALSFYMETKGPLGYMPTPLSVYRDFGQGTWTSADAFGQFQQRVHCREQARAVCSPELRPAIDEDVAKCVTEFRDYITKIQDRCRTLDRRIKTADEKIAALEKAQTALQAKLKSAESARLGGVRLTARQKREIDALHNSEAYRAGMFVTWPARKAWGGVKCLRENGIGYTAKHAVGKVARALGFRSVKW